jgi:hypothetical protein
LAKQKHGQGVKNNTDVILGPSVTLTINLRVNLPHSGPPITISPDVRTDGLTVPMVGELEASVVEESVANEAPEN